MNQPLNTQSSKTRPLKTPYPDNNNQSPEVPEVNHLAADIGLDPLGSEPWNYEETVTEVEEILARIESGHLELADVFVQFSAAVEHLRQCESFLADRQKQANLLMETLVDEAEF